MNFVKKLAVFLMVLGIVFGCNLVMNHYSNYVSAATSAPTPTPTPAPPTPYIIITCNIEKVSEASENGPKKGQFHVWSTQTGTIAADGWKKVAYTIGGTATNGVDYQTISGYIYILVGAALIPAPTDAPNTYIDINPIVDSLIEGPETVTLILQNVTVGSGSATMTIEDLSEVVPTPTPNPNAPVVVKGYVYDNTTDQPITGATVRMDTAGTTTDATGYYRISRVILPRPASISLTVLATGYQTQTGSVSVPSSGADAVKNFYLIPQASPTPTATPIITATPTITPAMYTLTVAIVLPADGGSTANMSITVNPPGTTFTAPTTFTYQPGTAVTLTANGTGFSSWSGALTGNQNPATITMNGNKTVYAVYGVDMPGSLKLQLYNGNTSTTANTLYPNFRITNSGITPLVLSTVKIRYYFTVNGDVAQNFYCDYSQVGSSNVTGTFVKLTIPKVGADYYLKIGFTSDAGSLAPGASINVQTRIAKFNWTNYTQTDDYSFNATATTYVDWTKITGYISDVLRWGVEP